MPTGRVKNYDAERKFGFLAPDDGLDDLYVHASDVDDGALTPGDVVEYDVTEGDQGEQATNVRIVHAAPEGNPVGRVMHPPPSWEDLQKMERKRRQRRRRRR